MKYVAKFKLKKRELPSDYRRIFISYFKKSLSEYMDSYFFNDYYNSGAKSKNLVWAVRLSKPIFDRKTIYINGDEIELIFKVTDIQTTLVYYSSLLAMKNIPFNIGNDNQMILKDIRMVKEPDIHENFAVFKIVSPICLRQHDRELNKDYYVTIEDEDFGTELCKKIKFDLKYYDEEVDMLLYNFDNLKKVVVPAYGLMIPSTIGTLAVKGDAKVLNIIKSIGIGSRRNSGFGLIDAIN